MSAYGKPQLPLLRGYDTSRVYPQTSYVYITPSYVAQPSDASSMSAPVYSSTTQMAQAGYASNEPRTAYDDHAGPYLNVGSAPVPEVTSFEPSRGAGGARISIYITALYELVTAHPPVFCVMFGQTRCRAGLTRMGQHGAVCQYEVSTEIPHFAATRWSCPTVPVLLFMESADGDMMGRIDVGDFTYTDSGMQSMDAHRKRKISAGSAEFIKSPMKRVSNQHMRSRDDYSGYDYASSASYTPYYSEGSTYDGLPAHFSRSGTTYQDQQKHTSSYSYSHPGPPPLTIKASSPHGSAWSPAYSTMGQHLDRSPGITSVGTSRPVISTSAAGSANPPLIRTSTLPQTPSPSSTPQSVFNAYTLYPHKAKLEIQGDLDSMAQNWTDEEWETKRRIVHFRRSQIGSIITTEFQPIAADERPSNAVCVSCIYWEEKQACFITSVDTIYLLEQLVAARFTVEEKNRIRRNLEGFRPFTVSKGKPDSEEFFKTIMAFPNPKPRNIEKDVKVFQWKDLANSLKKIMSKYSASPSSTLPPAPILTPVSSTGYATEGPSTGLSYDHHAALSPRSIAGSTTSTAYSSSIPGRNLSPHEQKPASLHQNEPSDLRVTVLHTTQDASGQWPSQHHMASSQPYAPNGSASASRGSWDISHYLETSPATSAPSGSATGNGPSSGMSYQSGILDDTPKRDARGREQDCA